MLRIPTRIHGVLDYLMGALLIASPWLLGFATGGPEQWAPVAVGATALAYSLVTDYELGAVRWLAVPWHLLLDALGGVALMASPWVLGFDEKVWIPHVAFGAAELLAALFTNTIPSYERRRAR
jgi:hypothetical protein